MCFPFASTPNEIKSLYLLQTCEGNPNLTNDKRGNKHSPALVDAAGGEAAHPKRCHPEVPNTKRDF
jgi:hypothetical protein